MEMAKKPAFVASMHASKDISVLRVLLGAGKSIVPIFWSFRLLL